MIAISLKVLDIQTSSSRRRRFRFHLVSWLHFLLLISLFATNVDIRCCNAYSLVAVIVVGDLAFSPRWTCRRRLLVLVVQQLRHLFLSDLLELKHFFVLLLAFGDVDRHL